MDPLPEFDEAVQRLRKHVGRAACGRQLAWFFAEDLVNQQGRLCVAAWRAAAIEMLASRFYDLRRSQGFGVALRAEFLTTRFVWCRIESPGDPEVAADLWIPRGQLKLCVAVPLREQIEVNHRASWWMRRVLSRIVSPQYPQPPNTSRAELRGALGVSRISDPGPPG